MKAILVCAKQGKVVPEIRVWNGETWDAPLKTTAKVLDAEEARKVRQTFDLGFGTSDYTIAIVPVDHDRHE